MCLLVLSTFHRHTNRVHHICDKVILSCMFGCTCVCVCVSCSYMYYIDNIAIMKAEWNKTKAQQMDVKAISFNPKTYTYTLHSHMYTYRARKWTDNHQRPKWERDLKKNKTTTTTTTFASIQWNTNVRKSLLLQRQWFLCKWTLVVWSSLSLCLFLFLACPLSLCNSWAYGTRAAFHSMLFIFAPVKSFASSFLHFIFKLFYVVGGFSVFRYGANNINVYMLIWTGSFFRRIFICAYHIASLCKVHVWFVFVFVFCAPTIPYVHSFIRQRALNALAFYIFKLR